ncbi:bis(5'-nucleosyl)-tetraphosphatase (symmetrical) YqeK [Aerococcaceae bacterium NML191292]|nr:bis(5'-nucleosyl)-tetraphosphatase (symmetrical) YqeK [Aerococcaceae bacterium NML191292]
MKNRGYLPIATENFLHAYSVGVAAFMLAEKFNENPFDAFVAGCLHDLGGAIPNSERIQVARKLKIPLFEEEIQVPMLVHAKLGAELAYSIFEIDNESILNSIIYHTTGIDEASDFEKIVFLADKIRWDRNGTPPYLKDLLKQLEYSLEKGYTYFLKWLWQSDLLIRHPYLHRSYGFYINGERCTDCKYRLSKNKLTLNLQRRYFLDRIHAEFTQVFDMANFAKKLAFERGVDANKAYLSAALVNVINTVPKDCYKNIARNIGESSNFSDYESFKDALNLHFVKTEIGIEDRDILNAIMYYRNSNKGNDLLCQVVLEAYERVVGGYH